MIARYAIAIAVVTAGALGACSTGQAADPWLGAPSPPVAAPREVSATSVATHDAKDIVELFATRILPTCSLNDGVCHNANNYPDLRNVAALADLVDLPCGRDQELEIRDACEPPGDHLLADGALDVVVNRVTFDEASNVATITTAADLPATGVLANVEIRRGERDRVLAASAEKATFVATAPRTITVQLGGATLAARTFFEPKLPMREDRIWPADMNGNGIAGASAGWREIVPGRPDRSWLVARLWNAELDPELMPRQCRAWNDTVTRSLGCWIEQLRTDEHGTPTNFFEPIDYAACKFSVPTEGRCGAGP